MTTRFGRYSVAALGVFFLLGAARPAQNGSTRVLIVGGGPNPEYNQVAIENNVRWVDTLVPRKISRSILYCDGKAQGPVVQISESAEGSGTALSLLYPPPEGSNRGRSDVSYRGTNVSQIDGPATLPGIESRFDALSRGKDPVLLYFTGHGSPNRSNFDDNRYDLWAEGGITPSLLSRQIEKLPAGTPVTVVMVQCFSGAFANLIFQNGDPNGPLLDRPVCGFFAATREREAAGCTPELNEAEYRDFTSSFFAGLTGRDRVGRKVPRPDYNGDGKVGFDEAYAFALITDPSIDVPVVTSDAFLRRFVPVSDDTEIVDIAWEKIRSAATPSQKAALDGICAAIGPAAQGPNRVAAALAEFRRRTRVGDARPRYDESIRSEIRSLRSLIGGIHPGLERGAKRDGIQADEYRDVWEKALSWLDSHPETLTRLRQLSKQVDEANRVAQDDSVTGARWLRLLRLSKSIALEMRLRESSDKTLIARFDALRKLEAGNPLWP